MSYEADGDGWLIQTRDITGMGLQNIGAADAVVSFAFIPGPEDAGVSVAPTAGLLTTEYGGTDSFSVVLDRQPAADVTIPISSSNTAEGDVDQTELVFTQDNWYVPQFVTVTGVDDDLQDGPQGYSIVVGTAVSKDGDFNDIDPPDVTATNIDDDSIGVTISPASGLETTNLVGRLPLRSSSILLPPRTW